MSTRKVMSHEARLAMVVLTVASLACCPDTVSANRRCGGGLKPHTPTGGPCIPDSASVLALEDGVAGIPVRLPRRELQAFVYVGGSAVVFVLLLVGCTFCIYRWFMIASQVGVTQPDPAPPPQPAGWPHQAYPMPPIPNLLSLYASSGPEFLVDFTLQAS